MELSLAETEFIDENFKHLSKEQKQDFIEKLTHLHTGEMAAYYIQRYGFYEGHTDYRADPIVLAFIFGLRSDFSLTRYWILPSFPSCGLSPSAIVTVNGNCFA